MTMKELVLELHNPTVTYNNRPTIWNIDFEIPEKKMAACIGLELMLVFLLGPPNGILLSRKTKNVDLPEPDEPMLSASEKKN